MTVGALRRTYQCVWLRALCPLGQPGETLLPSLDEDSWILLKGSNGIGLYKISSNIAKEVNMGRGFLSLGLLFCVGGLLAEPKMDLYDFANAVPAVWLNIAKQYVMGRGRFRVRGTEGMW